MEKLEKTEETKEGVETSEFAEIAERAKSLEEFKDELEKNGPEAEEFKNKIDQFERHERRINAFTRRDGLRENIARLYLREADDWQDFRERTLTVWPVIREHYKSYAAGPEDKGLKIKDWEDLDQLVDKAEKGKIKEEEIAPITTKIGLKTKFRELCKKTQEEIIKAAEESLKEAA